MRFAIYSNIGNKKGQDNENQLAQLKRYALSQDRVYRMRAGCKPMKKLGLRPCRTREHSSPSHTSTARGATRSELGRAPLRPVFQMVGWAQEADLQQAIEHLALMSRLGRIGL